MVVIENQTYQVNADEYVRVLHPEYTNLKLYKDLALHERLVGLIRHCAATLCCNDPSTVFCFHTTHGGFVPLQVSAFVDHVYVTETHADHLANIQENMKTLAPKYIHVGYPDRNPLDIQLDILYIEHLPDDRTIDDYRMITGSENWIILTDKHVPHKDSVVLQLSHTDRWVYVDRRIWNSFQHEFRFFLQQNQKEEEQEEESPGILDYDNLLHLCIMVKNGGPQFEQMLQENLPHIDQWTILDTGSTDETVNIINKVLVGKKEGHLYQEPFVNFRDSRNRLLELAGTHCKYLLMLDDTYVVKGDVHAFLSEVRSDQYATSFTLMIQSDDTKYGSNRIIKSNSGLRYMYRIHEVISDKNNINVVIPEKCAYIEDGRFDYMEKRTHDRKALDLVLLNEELQEDVNNPRTYYYLAQTYNCLEDYEKAFFYFLKRCEFTNAGFIQERVDAAFEAARLANFKLHRPWHVCEQLYEAAFKIDESRPESLYFIGIHYYLENNYDKAFGYFKRAFEIGFPAHCQYSLKPTLSYHFLPKFLARVCYSLEQYQLGEQACRLFLQHNPPTADDYREMLSWHNIFSKLNIYQGPKVPRVPEKPIFCFVADGGFAPWSGSNLLTTGVGGSETYIIEMARYIQRQGTFEVYVFCNTPGAKKTEEFEGVRYRHLDSYCEFIYTRYVKHVIVSRFSEYLPVTFKGFTENVYFVVHDLTPSGVVIPIDQKLKRVFCLTEWHVGHFTSIFPALAPLTVPFYYGIDHTFKNVDPAKKVKHEFIYSSFPNRGLLQLLQMWPTIYGNYPTATLHIYADVDNQWSNDVEPEKMNQIKQLLQGYQTQENGLGIYYHGWVSKSVLAKAWETADIWFYPCTFMETFCLTALEAASSRTLCVTNDLAALQNTVGQRGVVIEGDATTEEWQQRALRWLCHLMDEANVEEKKMFVELNAAWSKTLSWESQAMRLLQEHIAPNDLFEYKGMYNWTHDLPPGSKQIFEEVIAAFNQRYPKIQLGKSVSVLEIGTYSGMSLIEIVKRIPNATGVGVDRWANYDENALLTVVDSYGVKDSFFRNVRHAGLEGRIRGIQMDSTTVLLSFVEDKRAFDFIYVDGSHLLLDCYTDLVLSWQVLEPGGILAIDDYLYKKQEGNVLASPYEAVNHFLKGYKGKYQALHVGYRVFLEKL